MEEKFRTAIVGCGAIAQTHLRTMKKMNGLKIMAVCDRDEKKAIEASAKWNIDRYYTDFSKMLDNEDVSLVSILTPPGSHASLSVEAIKRGINVLVEKPLTMTTKEANPIMMALKQSNVKLTVDYSWLFSKAMLKALSLIRKQEIGDILNVEIKALHTGKDHMTSDQNHWCHKLPGGRIGEMLPHPVYALQSILGDNLQIKEMFALKHGDRPWMSYDELRVTLQSTRSLGSMYISFNAARDANLVDVYGTKKILKIDLTNQTVIGLGFRKWGSKLDSGKDSLRLSYKLALSTLKNTFDFLLLGKGEYALRNLYAMFIDNIKRDTEPLVTSKMAYNTVRIVEEICQGI